MGRRVFDKQLGRIQDDVLLLGSAVEEALAKSVDVLKRRDRDGARRLIAQDARINERRFAIETSILTLIATQQPVASDMRALAAALEIITELERIGDYAKGIAKINLMLGEEPLLKPLVDLPLMADKVGRMLRRALEAFVWRDVPLARDIPAEDDEVDRLYNQVERDLLDFILAEPSPSTIDRANQLLWAAHNLERAGDRVVNICERVVFMATGEMVEMNAQDGRLRSRISLCHEI